MTLLDGGFGTMVQAAGLPPGKDPAEWNIENPNAVTDIHRAYVDAGSRIVLTNTFGANRLKYHGPHPLGDVIAAAVRNARTAVSGLSDGRVALDIGPTGRLLKPAGDLDFNAAFEAFAETVRYGVAAGVDLVFIETMGDLHELKAAVLAAKANCDLPIFATVALGEDGRLLTGASVACAAVQLEALGVTAYGFNCGLGPDLMLPFVQRLAAVSTRPIIVKPNAGLPRLIDGRTIFDVDPAGFAASVEKLVAAGASIVGGCCGTTPAHLAAVARRVRFQEGSPCAARVRATDSFSTSVCSGSSVVELKPRNGTIIGERINPTGKKLLKEAYLKGDTAFVLREAVKQVEAGAAILDVNCGVPGIDEAATLAATVEAVQSVTSVPIQIDTSDPTALERALRRVNGKALVNSVNGKRESMDAVFPLVRKYGGTIVALCLDEQGIPDSPAERLDLAQRILAEGARYGFEKRDFVFDALTLAVSTDPQAAVKTLETVKLLTEELGVNTVLGVSNVSFGLPNRPALNNAMYTLAKRAGLSAAIANPAAIRESEDAAAFDVLLGRDANCANWIRLNAAGAAATPQTPPAGATAVTLKAAVIAGLKLDARQAATAELAAGRAPMQIVQAGIVPALEEVGRAFEVGRLYLPQLLMAADAAGEAFAVVRQALAAQPTAAATRRRPIVLATVKGDIHDIGKNIVRALLENYGFDVIDLGRDVPPEEIVAAVRKSGAGLVGLSALMTTTVGAMAETVRQVKAARLDCRTVVGGAVVTSDYAASIGADFYARDAMRTVRIAESVLPSRAAISSQL